MSLWCLYPFVLTDLTSSGKVGLILFVAVIAELAHLVKTVCSAYRCDRQLSMGMNLTSMAKVGNIAGFRQAGLEL
jgi:hypothetical protein